MDNVEKERYINSIIEVYKNNRNDESLTSTEKALLQQAFEKESNINKLLEQARTLQEEINDRNKQLQTLDQQVIFERGQMTGAVNALLALKNS